jgi:hypothetical protein
MAVDLKRFVGIVVIVSGMLVCCVKSQGSYNSCNGLLEVFLENEFVLHPEKLDSLYYQAAISALLKVTIHYVLH